jgi:predicted glycogen debranching enzyme
VRVKKDISEWIETDGLGGFASGTVSGQRTRRYHALLLVAQNPPADRVVLVNGFDAWVETPNGSHPISTQYYRNDVESPSGHLLLCSFTNNPWPTWRYQIADDVTIVQECFVPNRVQGVAMRWSVDGPRENVSLRIRPFLSGRDFHGMHHANPDFNSATTRHPQSISWQPYCDLPLVYAQSNATFNESFHWYQSFLYSAERDRGLDDMEDLGSPGEFHWDLAQQDAYLMLSAGHPLADLCGLMRATTKQYFETIEASERSRRERVGRESEIIRSYVVSRDEGTTVIAGYPWFGDWGRDTFIAMRGLCLTHRQWLDTGHDILMSWADTVSEGMLPNRFPDQGDTPEYNSVDASLWYIIAIQDSLDASRRAKHALPSEDIPRLQATIDAILEGYSNGTRFGIHLDDDGLIAAGQPGVQLTWMDAKVGDWVVTPRIGKPVEIQALWLNALAFAYRFSKRWKKQLELGRSSFVDRFWNEEGGCLYDVVDNNHESGSVDDAFRPNQIFAVGGLPLLLLSEDKTRRVIDAVEQRLLTPLGLRSLSSDHPDYQPRYEGEVLARDGAYHQGTVWPWLMGPFVEAWLRARGNSSEAKQEARKRFLLPLEMHLHQAGIGHISEICDAEPPHTPRGCPFQAWSFGEYLRIKHILLANGHNSNQPRVPAE